MIVTDGVSIVPMYQGRRISYPVCHPTVSHSQASHHVQDHHHVHSVGAGESSVPILGFSDADGRVRQRWPTQRQSYSENGAEEDGWQRPSRSRVVPASAREQVFVTQWLFVLKHSSVICNSCCEMFILMVHAHTEKYFFASI